MVATATVPQGQGQEQAPGPPPTGAPQDAPACPECGASELVDDAKHGETVCNACGLVVSELALDYGPEWREFTAEQRQARARAGPGRTIMRHDLGLGTVIGFGHDAQGQRIAGKNRAQLARMRRFHRQATYKPGADRELVRGLTEIERLANALGLPTSVAETAVVTYRKAREIRFLHGRSVEGTAAACTYAAARLQGVPRSLDDVCKLAQADEHDVARTYRRLAQQLKLPVPITQPTDLLPAFASRLELPAEVERLAFALIENAPEGNLTGKNPASVAAAALYLAGRELGEPRTQKDVSAVAGVTEVTVRARLKDLPRPETDGPVKNE